MCYGDRLRSCVATRDVLPFIGVYDVFSATLAARRFDALFLSGFGFAASHYGLPDIGFITWSDMVAYVQRVRTVLPDQHLLVDIDDGYCDVEVACHVVSLLERAGASGVVLEDQRRPRRCGHVAGKQILELETYLEKLARVLDTRRELFVIARTDASEHDEILRRVRAFEAAGADAVLVDGVGDLALVRSVRRAVHVPVAFNQMAGGKAPPFSLRDLRRAGVSLVIYSTPCLFAAQGAIEGALTELDARNGRLPGPDAGVPALGECNAVLKDNLARRQAADASPALTGLSA